MDEPDPFRGSPLGLTAPGRQRVQACLDGATHAALAVRALDDVGSAHGSLKQANGIVA